MEKYFHAQVAFIAIVLAVMAFIYFNCDAQCRYENGYKFGAAMKSGER